MSGFLVRDDPEAVWRRYNTGSRGMMTLATVPVLDAYDRALDALARTWACKTAGCSRVTVFELPAHPFNSRWSVAERVALHDNELLVFAGDVDDGFALEAPYEPTGVSDLPLPEALGKLRRPGACRLFLSFFLLPRRLFRP